MDLEKFNSFITQLFTEMSNEDSIVVLTFLLGAFLIGLLFGWWSGRSGVRKLKKELKKKDDELVTIKAEHQAVQEQLGLKEADLTKAHLEIEELKTKLSQIENEKAQVNAQLFESSSALEDLKADHLASLSQIEVLNNQIADFEDSTVSGDTYVGTKTQIGDVDLTAVQDKYDNASIRISAIEDKLARLERENANLKTEINTIKGDDTPIAFLDEEPTIEDNDEELEIEDVADDYNADSLIMDPEERAAAARQRIQAAFGERIIVANIADKDDLKKINGIGPFIEQKLNDIGIYTYNQISQFDDDLINQVTDAIQFFPGRIKRDDWVGQANRLKKG